MRILVDTCIWSSCLRRKTPDRGLTKHLKDLIGDGRVVMTGNIRQEILSGIDSDMQFEKIRMHLSAFRDIQLREEHYELAARYYNKCRKNGIQGAHADFLICAVASLENLLVFTTDKDFLHYKKYIPLSLWNKAVDSEEFRSGD